MYEERERARAKDRREKFATAQQQKGHIVSFVLGRSPGYSQYSREDENGQKQCVGRAPTAAAAATLGTTTISSSRDLKLHCTNAILSLCNARAGASSKFASEHFSLLAVCASFVRHCAVGGGAVLVVVVVVCCDRHMSHVV